MVLVINNYGAFVYCRPTYEDNYECIMKSRFGDNYHNLKRNTSWINKQMVVSYE